MGSSGLARIQKAMAQLQKFEIFWAAGHAKNSMTGDKTNLSIAIYFIPEKSNVLMTKREQKPPPKTNQPSPPTKTHLIAIGGRLSHGLILFQKPLKAPDWSLIFWLYLV